MRPEPDPAHGVVTAADVRDAILHVRERMLDEGLAESLEAINNGLCGDLADDVVALLVERKSLSWTTFRDVSSMSVAEFIQVDPDTGFSHDSGGPFDRSLLARHWPGVRPPEGLDWDDLDALSADAGFCAGTHVFLCHEGLFYDAEAPDGVPSFFDLPFFKRVAASWLEERATGNKP